MRRRLQELSLILCLVLAACSHPVVPGDRVAARWEDAFYEGTVLSIEGKLVMVQWDHGPPEKSGLPIDWVVKLDGPKPTPRVGQWLLCPAQKRWELCLVKSAGPQKLEVSGVAGEAVPYRPDALLSVPAGLVEWASQRGPAQVRRARMLELLPFATPATVGQRVEPGQLVLARWQDGNWWEATVKSTDGEQALVQWADGSAPTLREKGDVAPVTRLSTGVEEGELLVCRWKQETRWYRATVERAVGVTLELAFEDATRGKVFAGDCVRAK